MLSRTRASRRATTTLPSLSSTRIRIASRSRALQPARTLSVWPFARRASKDDQNLPVFFPQPSQPSIARTWTLNVLRRTRYAVFCLLVYYVLWQIFYSVVVKPLMEWEEAEWNALSEKEKKDLEQGSTAAEGEEDGDNAAGLALFLPFPFTMKQEEQPPYKASDPMWQAYQIFSRDEQLKEHVRKQLAVSVAPLVAKNPVLSAYTGKNIKVGQWWLVIGYPERPPPEHWLTGLLIDDEGIAIAERSVHPTEVPLLDSVQYPKALVSAIWTTFKTWGRCQAQQAAWALGLGVKDPNRARPQIVVTSIKSDSMPEVPWQLFDLNRILKPVRVDLRLPSPVPGTVGNVVLKGEPRSSINQTPNSNEVVKVLSANMSEALLAGAQVYAKGKAKANAQTPAGCVQLSGMVEIHGQTGFVIMQVASHYDILDQKFQNTRVGLFKASPWVSKPAPG